MTKKIKNLEYRSDKFLNSNSKKMIPFTGSITCYKKLNLLSREIENFSNYLENFIEYFEDK